MVIEGATEIFGHAKPSNIKISIKTTLWSTVLLGEYDVQLSIAWWDYRMTVLIRIADEELGSSNFFTEHTRPDVESEIACNLFCSLVCVFVAPPRMQVTSVCCSRCEICCFIGECDVFQESRLFLCIVQHVHLKTLCQSVILLDVITVFTSGF